MRQLMHQQSVGRNSFCVAVYVCFHSAHLHLKAKVNNSYTSRYNFSYFPFVAYEHKLGKSLNSFEQGITGWNVQHRNFVIGKYYCYG